MNGTLGALSEPNRLRIVELLRGGPRSVNEIAEQLALSQPLASKHLRVLREAGLVRVRVEAQQRVYELQRAPFEELGTWVEGFRRLWSDKLDRLDEYMQESKSKSKHGTG
jgi:DNA-binding transcriptional ArsR family regulator